MIKEFKCDTKREDVFFWIEPVREIFLVLGKKTRARKGERGVFFGFWKENL